tara:strand:- start:2165 stop:2458 length:294 start_codon:yes stop_codon:yes gene_type:complete
MRVLITLLILSFSSSTLAHQGHVEAAAALVCEQKEVADECEYQNQRADIYRGSCRLIMDTMMCVRSKPIEYSNSIFQVKEHSIFEPKASANSEHKSE